MDRFSQLYLERGQPARDSARLRHRLAAYFSESLAEHYGFPCRQMYERETGSPIPHRYTLAYVLQKAELRDALDGITITFRVLESRGANSAATFWREFVARAMREENVGYTIDNKCVVHFRVGRPRRLGDHTNPGTFAKGMTLE